MLTVQTAMDRTVPVPDPGMNILARSFFGLRRTSKALRLFFAIAGPGIIVMVADNDAGGITTYTTRCV